MTQRTHQVQSDLILRESSVTELRFFSGQIPLSPITGEVVGTTIEEQTEQVMLNIKALLESQNADFTDVVKTNLFPCRHG